MKGNKREKYIRRRRSTRLIDVKCARHLNRWTASLGWIPCLQQATTGCEVPNHMTKVFAQGPPAILGATVACLPMPREFKGDVAQGCLAASAPAERVLNELVNQENRSPHITHRLDTQSIRTDSSECTVVRNLDFTDSSQAQTGVIDSLKHQISLLEQRIAYIEVTPVRMAVLESPEYAAVCRDLDAQEERIQNIQQTVWNPAWDQVYLDMKDDRARIERLEHKTTHIEKCLAHMKCLFQLILWDLARMIPAITRSQTPALMATIGVCFPKLTFWMSPSGPNPESVVHFRMQTDSV